MCIRGYFDHARLFHYGVKQMKKIMTLSCLLSLMVVNMANATTTTTHDPVKPGVIFFWWDNIPWPPLPWYL